MMVILILENKSNWNNLWVGGEYNTENLNGDGVLVKNLGRMDLK